MDNENITDLNNCFKFTILLHFFSITKNNILHITAKSNKYLKKLCIKSNSGVISSPT